jgi:hypothetical protein
MSVEDEYPWPVEPGATLLEQVQERAHSILVQTDRRGRPCVTVDGEDFIIKPGSIEVMIGSNYMSEPATFNIDQAIELVAALLVAIEHAKELQSPK